MQVSPLLCCLLLGLPLSGQSLLQQLADEVCNCMSAAEIVYPRLQAGRCIEDVAKAHPERIQDELQLSVLLAADRRRLGELLVDPLAEHCTALLALGAEEIDRPGPELKYSDFSLARAADAPAVGKWPPPDVPATTLRDAPTYLQTSGELLEIDRDVIRILLDSGRVLTLHYQPRQLRRSPPRTGQRLQITYTENWTADDRRVTYDLLEMR
ncbi:hypothetical protein GGR26_000140 [Lewinella marina]|uniref:Uncharacterized protein n=1 Tax=Neolewinella marina TaxID=438751 RepID=A0A2G0CKA5_9BACT|nr:hypothetical protein [Neolewinella marina]NJB84395.1 hypothetical protein [Neolewinella marina]PHL00410.1 hypothetical protein CGL56_05085 [Neolewinella marina]